MAERAEGEAVSSLAWATSLIVFAGLLTLAAYLRLVAWNIRHPSFAALYERAFSDVAEILASEGATWWLCEGTLIWSLRYGVSHPKDIDDVVDDDIDVMVEVEDEAHWERLSKALIVEFESRGWSGTNRRSTSDEPGRRIDKLQIFLKGLPFQHTHVDFHSYFVDDERQIAWSTGDPNGYPFESWSGEAPLSLIHPLRESACWALRVPCPQQPMALLAAWHGGEYAGSPIALPLRALSVAERGALRARAHELDAMGVESMIEHWRLEDVNDPSGSDANLDERSPGTT
jgi:hypothetical protein